MKKIRFICVLLIFAVLSGCLGPAVFALNEGRTFYFDCENGDDDNSGLSPDEAWKNADMIESVKAVPGDRFLFRRGQTFSAGFVLPSSGTEDKRILISAYGEGDRPVFANDGALIGIATMDVSGWEISDIHFVPENGCGIFMMAMYDDVSFITIKDCSFTDICNYTLKITNTFKSAINIDNLENGFRVHDVLIDGIYVTRCPFGIHSNGVDTEIFGIIPKPEEEYNYNILIRNSVFRDCQSGAVVFGSMYNSKAENCCIEKCATNNYFPCAPIWFRHCDSCSVEHCEISGSANRQDGMTVDFDGWTTNCAYRYIYSHDNVRFIKNCLFDRYTSNAGNSVEYCLSVNDNKMNNLFTTPLIALGNILGMGLFMKDFTFSHNTLVNTSPVHFDLVRNAVVTNNIIIGQKALKPLTFFTNFTSLTMSGLFENNCFYNYCVPFNAKNSMQVNPELDENMMSPVLGPDMGALNGDNYVGCTLNIDEIAFE
ncbi:MAG: hypothetical protein K6B52_02040 [Clostridiales bacterium]|nr:hypothetical protein [Clostridiales bacterium]